MLDGFPEEGEHDGDGGNGDDGGGGDGGGGDSRRRGNMILAVERAHNNADPRRQPNLASN